MAPSALATASRPAPAFPGTASACACRWTAPPACRCGRTQNASQPPNLLDDRILLIAPDNLLLSDNDEWKREENETSSGSQKNDRNEGRRGAKTHPRKNRCHDESLHRERTTVHAVK